MAALNLTSYQAALKQMYPRSRIENLTFRNNPLLAMVRKNTNVGGENWKIPIQYEDIPSRSATFSTALANKSPSSKVAFLMTAVNDYALASIEGKVWRASQGNAKAFLEASRSELDSAFNAMRRSLGIAMYRSGGGAVGRTTEVTGTTITLVTRRDVNNFGVGMRLKFAASDGGALRGGITPTVTAVNRGAGTLTVDQSIAGVTGITTLDYIHPEGDGANAGSNLRMTGLLGWLPTTAPTAGDSHFGVDRSVDVVRLAGNRINCTGLSMEEALIRTATEIGEQGGMPDTCMLPFNLWEQLGLELGAKKEYGDVQVAGVHFKTLNVHSPEGTVRVLADRNCPSGYGFMLTLGTWTLYSIGPCPGILDLDRVGAFLRETSADAYELRVGCYPQLGTHSPGHNAVMYNLPV